MFCPNCFNESSTGVCASCGFNIEGYSETATSLPSYTILNAKYLIGRVLGQGGFGVTYKAKNLQDGKIYCIKEYFPSEFAVRRRGTLIIEANSPQYQKIYNHGKESFLDEARLLYKFRHNPIVTKVFDYFEENGTAYFVMEFLDGMNLKQAAFNMGGKISVENANGIFVIIASGLVEIHKQKILHRDISPENIFVTKDYNIKLIDFGAARNYIKSQNNGMSVLLKPGFAPPEQYKAKGNQGEWTDVYALALTYYSIVSGKKPIDAMSRMAGDKIPLLSDICPDVSVKNAKVMEKAYALNVNDRYQNFNDLLKDFDLVIPKASFSNSQSVKSVNTIPSTQSRKTDVSGGNNTGKSNTGNSNTGNSNTGNSNTGNSNTGNSNIGNGNIGKANNPINDNKTTIPGITHQSRTGANTVLKNSGNVNTAMKKGFFAKVFGKKRPYLVVHINSNNKIYPLNDSAYTTIGRSKSCDITVDDEQISRIHCYVRFNSEKRLFVVYDNSANGTFDSNGRLKSGKEYLYEPGSKINLINPRIELSFVLN